MEMTVTLAGYVAQIRIRAKYTTDVWFERDEPDHLTTLIYWTVIVRKNNYDDNNIISTSRSKRTIDTWLKVVTEHQIIDVSMDESRWRRCRAARSERREIGKESFDVNIMRWQSLFNHPHVKHVQNVTTTSTKKDVTPSRYDVNEPK